MLGMYRLLRIRALVTFLISTCTYDLSRRIAVVVQKQRQNSGTSLLKKFEQIIHQSLKKMFCIKSLMHAKTTTQYFLILSSIVHRMLVWNV